MGRGCCPRLNFAAFCHSDPTVHALPFSKPTRGSLPTGSPLDSPNAPAVHPLAGVSGCSRRCQGAHAFRRNRGERLAPVPPPAPGRRRSAAKPTHPLSAEHCSLLQPGANTTHVGGGWTAVVTHENSTLYMSVVLLEEITTDDAEACHTKCLDAEAACLAWTWCPKTEAAGWAGRGRWLRSAGRRWPVWLRALSSTGRQSRIVPPHAQQSTPTACSRAEPSDTTGARWRTASRSTRPTPLLPAPAA